MGHVISMTIPQGSTLLRLLHTPGWRMPSAIGEKKFSESAASQCNRRMHLFFKKLRKNSPILTDDDKFHFGPRDAYSTRTRRPIMTEIESGEDADKELVIYEILDHKKTVDLDLTGKERDGLYWALFLVSHPSSVYCQGPAAQEMLVWPLIEQIGMVGQLEDDICLRKGEVLELKSDKEREEEEESKGEVKGTAESAKK